MRHLRAIPNSAAAGRAVFFCGNSFLVAAFLTASKTKYDNPTT
jgi:hypothetical protein